MKRFLLCIAVAATLAGCASTGTSTTPPINYQAVLASDCALANQEITALVPAISLIAATPADQAKLAKAQAAVASVCTAVQSITPVTNAQSLEQDLLVVLPDLLSLYQAYGGKV